jgi:hypothetical protein
MLRKILYFVCVQAVVVAVWGVFLAIAVYAFNLKAIDFKSFHWLMPFGWVCGTVAIFLGDKVTQLFSREQATDLETGPTEYERGYSAVKKDEENNRGLEREPFKYG